MSVAPNPPISAPGDQGAPLATNLFQRIFLIVLASVLLTAIASFFVFAQLKDDLRTLQAELKAARGDLATLATKEELEKRLSKEDLEKRLKVDLETVAATKKALEELGKQHALDAKANKEELEKRLTKDDLEKRLKTDAEALAVAKKAVEDLAKQHALDILAAKKEMETLAAKKDLENLAAKKDLESLAAKKDLESLAAKKDLEGLATKQGLKELADGTMVRKVRLERKDLQEALKYRGTLEEKDRNDHELVFSLNTTGGRGEVLVNLASNVSEIDHLTADSLPAEGKPFGVKLVFKNPVTEIPEKWFIELSVYRAGATEYKVAAGAAGK